MHFNFTTQFLENSSSFFRFHKDVLEIIIELKPVSKSSRIYTHEIQSHIRSLIHHFVEFSF